MIRYYPVLKWKKGEQLALKNLSQEQQSSIAPIIEIVDAITPEKFLNTLNVINTTRPIYIDTENIDSKNNCIISIVSKAQEKNMPVYPVLPLTSFLNNELPASLTKHSLFRVPVIATVDGPSSDEIVKRIEDINKDSFGIILDIGPTVRSEYVNLQYASLLNFLNKYQGFLLTASSVIICTSSFPEDISDIGSGKEHRYNRYDFSIFSKIVSEFNEHELINILAFSDYGVSKFTETNIDFSKMQYPILPKVKYTSTSQYIILKGKRDHLRGVMTISYNDLAKQIITSDYYCGKEFSYGDEQIDIIAKSADRTGNATNWVTYCANHHIALLLKQTSNLF